MSYFYRVEDAKGYGPYRGETVAHKWARKHHINVPGVTPGPYEDFGADWIDIQYAYEGLFGFRNLSQVQAWFFPEELLALHKVGCKIVRVKGEAILESPYQVYFKPSEDQLWERAYYQSCSIEAIMELMLTPMPF